MSKKDREKGWLLKRILDDRDRLLGKYDDSHGIMKKTQARRWAELCEEAKTEGITFAMGPTKNGKYLRDEYNRWRRNVLLTKEKLGKTGSEG